MALGVTAFGSNEIRLSPGGQGRGHDEQKGAEEEVYVGLAGSGTFTVDDEVLDFGPGSYLRVDPRSTRVAEAGPDGLTYLAIGAPVGSRRDRPMLEERARSAAATRLPSPPRQSTTSNPHQVVTHRAISARSAQDDSFCALRAGKVQGSDPITRSYGV